MKRISILLLVVFFLSCEDKNSEQDDNTIHEFTLHGNDRVSSLLMSSEEYSEWINEDGFTDLSLKNRYSIFNKFQFFNKNGDNPLNLTVRYLNEDRWGGQMNFTEQDRGKNTSYGESILTNTQMIYEDLKNKNNKILKILKSKFLFERRGFGKNKTFLKPIFEKNGKKTKFRYLRDYIESAYKLKNIKINKNKVTALDYLDRLLNQKKFQKNYKLKAGDLIILNNKIFAHGRKTFRVSKNINRTLLRAWIK